MWLDTPFCQVGIGLFVMKRRQLMEAWVKYCESAAREAKVLPMKRQAKSEAKR